MNLEVMWKLSIASLGGITGYLFGGWTMGLQVLLTFMIVDQVTGLLASYIQGTLSSKVGYKGIAKKAGALCIVVVCHHIDMILNSGQTVMEASIWFYIANELLSIVENAGRMGIGLPPQIENAVAILKNKGESKDGK